MIVNRSERIPDRSYRLLYKKFVHYIIPTMITYAALSLNEFVDSMLVSNLLGSEAMAIVNLGMPVMLVMSAVYSLFGSGGSTVYAIALGRHDHDTAGKSLTSSAAAALIIGLVLMAFSVFTGRIAIMLCSDQELLPCFTDYLRVLFWSSPLVIVLLTIVSFLPAAGYPGFATAVNVIANVINIAMDYVFIRFFNMDVEGAAWATLTGYVFATAVMIAACLSKRIRLLFDRSISGSMTLIKELVRYGISDSVNQIGLSFQAAFINMLAILAAGSAGVVAYSLCMQAGSVMSVFIGAVVGSAVPMLAVLHGQRDISGKTGILKLAMLSQFLISAAGTALFIIFAPGVAAIYNISDQTQLPMAVTALRIYSLLFIPRFTVIVFYRYVKIIGLTRYSAVLSALDSFAAVIPLAWICVRIWGIDGLWYAFLLASCILLIMSLICNLWFASRSGGSLKWPLLLETGDGSGLVMDVTISNDPAEISDISMKLQKTCEDNGMERRDAVRVALAVEEIAVNAAARMEQDGYFDILVRNDRDAVEIEFRTIGKEYDLLKDDAGKLMENISVLQGIASDIKSEYIMGMNSTRIIL